MDQYTKAIQQLCSKPVTGEVNDMIVTLRSYHPKALNNYYQTAYMYLQKNYSGSETNKLVQSYEKALQQKDDQKAKAPVRGLPVEGLQNRLWARSIKW